MRDAAAALRRYTRARWLGAHGREPADARVCWIFRWLMRGLAMRCMRDWIVGAGGAKRSWAKSAGEVCGCSRQAAQIERRICKRPDLGRGWMRRAARMLRGTRVGGERIWPWLIADGLSALAVERHAAALLKELLPQLSDWRLAPICIVEQGRVAIGDEIGLALGARMAVVLIGERPGLSSPDSLGAYITWAPRPGRTDAERNCISNIRSDIGSEGLGPEQAAAELAGTLLEASRETTDRRGVEDDAEDAEKG